MSFLLLVAFLPAVQAAPKPPPSTRQVLILSMGTAYVTSSGNPSCTLQVPGSAGWSWDGVLNAYYRYVDFTQYGKIQASLSYSLNSPGLVDTSTADLIANQKDTSGNWVQMDWETYTNNKGGLKTGTLTTSSLAIGTRDWFFQTDQLGVDWSPSYPFWRFSCTAVQNFYVYQKPSGTMSVTIYTYEKWRGDPNPGPGQPVPADVYRDNVKVGTSDSTGLFVDHPTWGTHSYFAQSGTYKSSTQTASSDATLYLTILTPY